MALFTYYSRAFYDGAGARSAELNSPGGANYNSDDIDDGFWDVGDDRTNGSNFKYAGYFDSGGIRILTFEFPTVGTYMVSTSQSAGGLFNEYPATYVPGDITLTTTQLADCFAPGTQIATQDGTRSVEDLAIGDAVVTERGDLSTVRWIGRQTVFKLFAGPHIQPVRIRAGALGGGLPHSDLTVTADHGMVIDGLVINASALVNGHSINFVPMAELEDSYTVYHVETEAHDVILANGAPSETFIDYRDRRAFDNYQEYLDLYGCERIIPEMPAPRISSQRLLPDAIKGKLHILQTPVDDLLSTCA